MERPHRQPHFLRGIHPIAFRTLSVITTRESAESMGQLFGVTDIADYVREVSYHDIRASTVERTLEHGVFSNPSSKKQFYTLSLCTRDGGLRHIRQS